MTNGDGSSLLLPLQPSKHKDWDYLQTDHRSAGWFLVVENVHLVSSSWLGMRAHISLDVFMGWVWVPVLYCVILTKEKTRMDSSIPSCRHVLVIIWDGLELWANLKKKKKTRMDSSIPSCRHVLVIIWDGMELWATGILASCYVHADFSLFIYSLCPNFKSF
jgi:hypothetical protein